MTQVSHGTYSRYTMGCRCGPCKTAAREYRKILRTRGLPRNSPKHGTVYGYQQRGCRCGGCREAKRLYYARYMAFR